MIGGIPVDCIHCSSPVHAVTSVVTGKSTHPAPADLWFCEGCRAVFTCAAPLEEYTIADPVQSNDEGFDGDPACTVTCECEFTVESRHESAATNLFLAHWETTGHERYTITYGSSGRAVRRRLSRDEKLGWCGSEAPPMLDA